jgi:hypothetical protein
MSTIHSKGDVNHLILSECYADVPCPWGVVVWIEGMAGGKVVGGFPRWIGAMSLTVDGVDRTILRAFMYIQNPHSKKHM